ncbi:MAG: ATP-binding cassette domain-containing protein [Holosporales bacterium]|nr:ATP-binding cassette domain-containing protein [Holosporales bacterium]
MFLGNDISFARGGRSLVYPFSFSLKAGEWVAVQGPNGSGKSSFLRLLAGLLPCTTGTFMWETSFFCPSHPSHRARVSYVASPPHQGFLSYPLKKNLPLLKEWGLDFYLLQPQRMLSQGQKQRLALLELSLSRRSLWLLDEPTQYLDEEGHKLFLKIFKAHLERGGIAFVVTHQSLTVPHHQHLTFHGD